MNIQFLFATPISFSLIDDKEIDNCEFHLSEIFNNKSKITFNDYFGWKTTEDNLHLKDEFSNLIELIKNDAKTYSEDVLGIDFLDFEMNSLWSNSHKSISRHSIHQHPNSFFSGVIYIKVPEEDSGGVITFIDPRPAKNMFFADFKKQTTVSERSQWYKPVKGMMILFPSWLEHGTEPFMSENSERVSMSFNFILKKCTYNTMRI